MTAINHALSGTIIGLTISNPLIVIPLAFLSHYFLDAIPHFGSSQDNDKFIKSNAFKTFLSLDILLCFLLVGLIFIAHPKNYFMVILAAFLATSPDFINLKRFILINKNKTFKPGLIYRFSAKIQWFERPIGAVVEAVWFLSGWLVTLNLLFK